MGDPRAVAWRLAIARSLGVTGAIATNTALVYVLYDRFRSTGWIAAYFIVTFAGYGLFQPLGGILADRFDRKRLMVGANVAGAGAFVLLAFQTRPGAIVACALLAMVVSAPFLPASRASLPNLVGLDELTWANGVLARTFAVAITAGPAIGGALVGPIGAKGVVLGSAGCSLVAGLLCLRINGSFAEGATASDQERGGVLAGIVFIGREPLLRAIVIAEVVAFTGSGLAIVADAPLAVMFDAGALGYGALIILWGLGMLVGSWLAGRIREPRRELPAMIAGMATMGVGMLLIWPAPTFVLILGCLLLGGVGMGVIEVARQSVLQRRTPDAVRGRVFSAADAIGSVSFAGSFALAAAVVGVIGPKASYGAAGITYLCGVVVVIVLIGRRVAVAEAW